MHLLARVYLKFKSFYTQKSEIRLTDALNNAGDVYRRETVHVLCRAIEELCEQEDEELKKLSITGQKSGLKLSILNLRKLTGDQLVGYFLVELQDDRSKKVVQFLKVLKLFENDYFGDVYCDLKYRRNRTL